jgi:hypothetical protein
MKRSTFYLATAIMSIVAFTPITNSIATTPDWSQPVAAKTVKQQESAVIKKGFSATAEQGARWDRVAGCARDIAAGQRDVVYVTGCDVIPNSLGSSRFYRWNGAAFVPLTAPGHGSAIATFGGNSYTIGGDGMLYDSINDGTWAKRRTPYGRPITDVGAGNGGLWTITSMPSAEGNNTIARLLRCPTESGQLLGSADVCDWEIIPGAATRISVGATAWVVNAKGQIYEWNGNGSEGWLRRPGCFTDVAANGHEVYAVSCNRGNGDGNAIYRWSRDGHWVDVQGAGKRVAVDAAGNAWAITDSGEIWRRSDRRN